MVDEIAVESGGTEKDLKKYGGPQGVAKRWLREIDNVLKSKEQRQFETRGERINRMYKNASTKTDDGSQSSGPIFNVLWSNVKLLKPTYFARIPKVVAERTFKDSDPVGRCAAMIAERTVQYAVQSQQDRFRYAVRDAVQDRLLPGRGQVWLRYEAGFEDQKDDNGEPVVGADGQAVKVLKPHSEKVVIDPLNWLDYLECKARNQYEVRWRARRVYMTRAKLVSRFGKVGEQVDLTHNASKTKQAEQENEFLAQAVVWEIHDQEGNQRVWVSEGYKDAPLDVKPGLQLKDFWPCPLPLLATTTTDSTYPTADWEIYRRLADEIDFIMKRLSAMVDCVKLVGAMAASYHKDVKDMLKLADGQLWPMEDWPSFSERGGLNGSIDWMPFDNCTKAIPVLSAYLENLLAKLDLVTGIPDIARGQTDPNETAEAQQRKSHWTVVKITEDQGEVQRFCREIVAKIAELIFEPGLFTDETIMLMSGAQQMSPENQQVFPQALQLLRDDKLRTFRIDIETDSTIATDEEDDKSSRMEYVDAVTKLTQSLEQVSQFRPELMHPMIESALFAIRPFRTGRSVEGAWEQAMESIEANDKAAKENPPPPPRDYEGEKIDLMKQELAQKQADSQWKSNQAMETLSLKGEAQKADFAIKSQAVEIQGMKVQTQAQIDATAQQLDQFQAQFAQHVQSTTLELEKFKTIMDVKAKAKAELRLDKETELETVRMAHDHVVAARDHAIAGAEIHLGHAQLASDHQLGHANLASSHQLGHRQADIAQQSADQAMKQAAAEPKKPTTPTQPKTPPPPVNVNINVPGSKPSKK